MSTYTRYSSASLVRAGPENAKMHGLVNGPLPCHCEEWCELSGSLFHTAETRFIRVFLPKIRGT